MRSEGKEVMIMQYVLEWAMWIYMYKLKGKRSKKIRREKETRMISVGNGRGQNEQHRTGNFVQE